MTLLKGNKGKYRALVTDINLVGRIDGWEVARLARQIDPAFPILCITGAHADRWPSHGVPNSILLTKPFAPAQLVTAISQLLNDGMPTTYDAASAASLYRADRNAIASTTSHPTMTREATAPAVILALSFVV